jgi:hypothetical protein
MARTVAEDTDRVTGIAKRRIDRGQRLVDVPSVPHGVDE